MNEHTKSTIRQILLIAAGVGPISALLVKLGINPADFPMYVDLLLLIGGGIASLWALWTRRKKAIVAQAADIVPVPIASQKAVGIPDEKVVVLPTNPPSPKPT